MQKHTESQPKQILFGHHTKDALSNFPYSGHKIPPVLIHAYGAVKKACLLTCKSCGAFHTEKKADALIEAADEIYRGLHDTQFLVDMMQGGAGISINMTVNEVITARAQQLLDDTAIPVSPLDDANRYQSTNDTFPTAVKLAAITSIQQLEESLIHLQESLQEKERAYAGITKVGRTEYQDAVLTTLGREFGCYAEAVGRDRWRVFKCTERLRTINLGGTAIGTGINAERSYILRVTETLREISGIGFARAENLMDATQNCDIFAEVSGILSACAVNLQKIANDLRFLSSGPHSAVGEITLPKRQSGSSIMPGKVNPVIPEAVIQGSIQISAYHSAITQAAASGNLELNPFLPLIAYNLLDSISILTVSADILARHCIEGITVNKEIIHTTLENATSVITAFVRDLGYDECSIIAQRCIAENRSPKDILIREYEYTEDQYSSRISADSVCSLGFKKTREKQ